MVVESFNAWELLQVSCETLSHAMFLAFYGPKVERWWEDPFALCGPFYKFWSREAVYFSHICFGPSFVIVFAGCCVLSISPEMSGLVYTVTMYLWKQPNVKYFTLNSVFHCFWILFCLNYSLLDWLSQLCMQQKTFLYDLHIYCFFSFFFFFPSKA